MRAAANARNLATLALAVAAPATVVIGIAVVVMIPRGVPRLLVGLLALSTAIAALSILTFLAVDAYGRSGGPEDPGVGR